MSFARNDALIVVDVQQDFCAGGALAVPNGDEVVPVINLLSPHFHHLMFTRDCHPENHCSFSSEPEFVDKSWPPHCVKGTPGAALHPALIVPEDALIIDAGQDPEHEAYSGFEGTDLAAILRSRGVQRLFVLGLATDFCVKETTLDAIRAGFETFLVTDGCRGINRPAGNLAAALDEMKQAGAVFTTSGELL